MVMQPKPWKHSIWKELIDLEEPKDSQPQQLLIRCKVNAKIVSAFLGSQPQKFSQT